MKIPRDAIGPDDWQAIDHGMVVHVREGEVRYRLQGSGALTCLQGLVTCDLRPAGPLRFFGALLTSKGMIVAPLWIEKLDDQHFLLETPQPAAAALEDVLRKSLPPRQCTWENVTAHTASVGTYGPQAKKARGALPAVARGAQGFDSIIDTSTHRRSHEQASSSRFLLEACRILAGIPALGAEIDEKTLPQEVRFDELNAVSYTKGCYLGQETVARVHFRGHPNRHLVFAELGDEPPDPPAELRDAEGKNVGRLTSVVWSPALDRWAGQAVVRREASDGATLTIADGGSAVIRLSGWPRTP